MDPFWIHCEWCGLLSCISTTLGAVYPIVGWVPCGFWIVVCGSDNDPFSMADVHRSFENGCGLLLSVMDERRMFARTGTRISFAVSLLDRQRKMGGQFPAVASIIYEANHVNPDSPYIFSIGPSGEVYGTMLAFEGTVELKDQDSACTPISTTLKRKRQPDANEGSDKDKKNTNKDERTKNTRGLIRKPTYTGTKIYQCQVVVT